MVAILVNVLALFFNGAKNELDGVNHCSNAAGNCCESNSLFYGCINCDLIVRTVIGVLCKSIFNAVNLDLRSICFILCNVNDNACYVIGNCKLKCSCSGACTKFDTGVTLSIVRRSVNLIHVGKLKCVSICSIRLGSAKCVTVNMSCIAVSAEVEYNLSNNCTFLVTAMLTYAINVNVICNVTCCCTANSTSCRILTCSFRPVVLVSNNLVKPTVLHLKCSVVLTDNTVNGNFVACNGLVAHSVVSGIAVCAVETVNHEICTFKLDVTVLSIVNLGNNTGYIVLISCVCVVCKEICKSLSLFKCKSSTVSRLNYLAALVITLEVAVLILVTERICLVSGVGIIAESTSVSGVSTLCAGRICYNYVVVVLERRNYLCVCIAARASEGLNAVLCASRSGGYLGCVGVGVAESRNCTCFDLAASALAVLRAFCIDGRLNVNDPLAEGMTCSRNNLLSFENFLTNGTVRTFCKTCLSTCGSNCLVNYGSMTCSGNNLLSFKNLAAFGAVRACSKTCLCASRSNCLVNYNGVTERIAVFFSANLTNSLVFTGSRATLMTKRFAVFLVTGSTDGTLLAGSRATNVNVGNPLCIDHCVVCDFVGVEAPETGAFSIRIPVYEIITLSCGVFGSCCKTAFRNCLCRNISSFAGDEVYDIFVLFYRRINLVKPIAKGIAAGCERKYHDQC